jgi:two-component system LytT family response regulator
MTPDPPTNVRALIVDDEEPARRLLRALLSVWSRVSVIGEAADGEAAASLIRDERPDLVFLDVQMPRMTGFDVVAAISPESMPTVVFVTAYDQYALRAFEVSACDYLLKPFDEDRLAMAVQRALERHDQRNQLTGAALRSLLSEVRQSPESQIVLKVDGRHVFLSPSEIDWIEASGKELRVHVGKNALVVRESMSSLELRLEPHRFIRVHRSAMVNRSRIREMQPWFQGEYVLILRDGTKVTTGRSYREAVQRLVRDGAR